MNKRLNPIMIYYLYKGGFAFCFTLMATVSAIYQIQLARLNPLQIVVVGAVLELSCLIFEIPTGVVSDMYSRKLSICMGLAIMGVGIIIEGLFPVFSLILISQVIWGAGATFLSGSDVAWLTDEINKENVERTILRGTQVYQIASIFGVVISIALAVLRLNYPILLSGSLFILLGIGLLLYMPEKPFKPSVSPREPFLKKYISPVRQGIGHVVNYRSLQLFFIALLLGGFYNEGFDRLWTYHLMNDVGMEKMLHFSELYWFAVIQVILLFINFFALKFVEGTIKGKSSEKLYTVVLFNNIVLLLCITAFSMNVGFYFAIMAFWGVMAARCINEPLNMMIVNNTIMDNKIRATVLSMKGQMDQIGQIIGGLCIGLIANTFSVSVGIQSSAIFVVAIIIILWVIRRK